MPGGLRRIELPSRSGEVGSKGWLGMPCQFEDAHGCLVVDPPSGRKVPPSWPGWPERVNLGGDAQVGEQGEVAVVVQVTVCAVS